MLPLQLVKTPHKILSMNLTIKFKQFLNKIEAYIKCRYFELFLPHNEGAYGDMRLNYKMEQLKITSFRV